jgi:hypothetical protein
MDTRNKRSSAIGVGLPWRGMLPAPDGAIDAQDRLHVAWLYAGIAAEEIEPPAFILADDIITFPGDNPVITFSTDGGVITFAGDNPVILMR